MSAPTPPLLEVRDLAKHYRAPRASLLAPAPPVHALRDVSFTLQAGRHLGIVGESGSGKSTLARLVMALEPPSAGEVRWCGRDLHAMNASELRAARTGFQMVFQDPYGSLDPRQRIERIVAEPMDAHADLPARGSAARRAAVTAVLEAVGLGATDLDRFPHQFSGGQRQRIAIARALVTRPRLIVADEAVSALDVSVQAQVINLLQDLADQVGVSYLFVSHDLAVIDHLCHEVAVLYQGRIVETGTPQQLFAGAAHPYTQALRAAVPRAEPPAPGTRRRAGLAPPSQSLPVVPLTQNPSADDDAACAYAPRCALRESRCTRERPELRELAPGHRVACHMAGHASDGGTI